MSLLQILRRSIFWIFDTLKGSGIRKNFKDIRESIEDYGSVSTKVKKEKLLTQLLQYAQKNTEFYKKHSHLTSLDTFPVINKNLIRDNFEAFKSSKFSKNQYELVSTSGSTGAPFSVVHNMTKRLRNRSDSLYFSKRSGYSVGQKLVYIKIWPDTFDFKTLFTIWKKNILPQSVFELTDSDIENLLKKLVKDPCEKSFLGYSSAFEKICLYLDKIDSGPIDCNARSIIAMSESLNQYTRDSLKKYFGVTPVSRYSNNENGILAQQDRNDPVKFVINSASYHIEIFNLEKDIPASPGELGRIIVTDLYNYAMPLIRYDTGDVGVIEYKDNMEFLTSIEGRKLDLIYNTKGEIIPSHISYRLCKYGDYKQFQLIQYGKKEYLIKLNTDTKVDEASMLFEYKNYFGEDADITIEYVDEIPLLSSGKRREVYNTYYQNL
ncbi:hypothetical protein [Aquimarina pacifica]|uniref:hypothetical protein n=1 Tax=Aquimarina pacifica TaxID=1296415 RepID=UPI00046EB65D|nr:hypothetical protein [Aquimarina pacifica]